MRRRLLSVVALTISLIVSLPAASWACGGLVAGKHAEVLRRATTLAAWVDGVEHYVTGFTFAGTADSFGYIIPLPAIPSEIKKGGDWMLERLDREAFPQPTREAAFSSSADATAGGVQVVKAVKIDSLDIKVVKGGGRDVAAWAREHGFDMTPDTDDLLAKYKANIFALAKFEKTEAAKRFVEGQGVVIDFEIPLPGPWIPLRILALGKQKVEVVNAHLFLLTPEKPMLSPNPASLTGMKVVRDEWASESLISDLRSDTNTQWIPQKAWFTALELSVETPNLTYDLAGLSGGIMPVNIPVADGRWWPFPLIAASLAGLAAGLIRRRRVKDATAA